MRPVRLLPRVLMAAMVSTGLSLTLAPFASAQSSGSAPAVNLNGGAAPAAPAPGAAPAAPTPADPNTVVATVDGQDVHLSDLQALAQNLPQQLQGMSADQLYPILLEQLVDQKAMAIVARKDGLENDPGVQKRIQVGTEQVLQQALFAKDVGPLVTEDAIKKAYDAQYAGKPGEKEIHARHILVDNEAQAKDIIKQLDHGGDFAALAKKYSKDPGASNGGDLGWFKKTDMVPEFATAAFAMKDNQITQKPVHTQFGWHVIQVLGHKTDAAPSLADLHDKIRNQLIQENVHTLLDKVRGQVTIKEFGPDGTPLPAPDDATSAPAAGAAPAASGSAAKAK